MSSLFWKIFFTFWFTILIIELATAWITADLSETEIHPILEQQNAEFIASSTQVVYVLTKDGLPSLRDWLQNESNLTGIDDVFIINSKHQEIDNKPLPVNVAAILRNDHMDQALVDHYQPIKHTLTFKTTTPQGDDYLVISTFEHPPLVKYLAAPQRIALSVIISGLICLMLARYFTSPLTKLRRSTQLMTFGEFDTTNLQHLRKRNDEFGALAVDYESMMVRLNELLLAQKQLLRDISHELRSPLTRIRVALGLARNKYKSADNEELDRIDWEIERLEFLIRELLTFVKIEPNNSTVSMTQVDIHELLSHVIKDAEYEQQQSHISQTITLKCPHNIEINANAHLLHRAIENIIRNARYYSPENAIITVQCNLRSNYAHIKITDEGPGVPENMLEKIFQPFVRVSSARESDTGGSGIGLAIAKRVIDIHNGKMRATNRKDGKGLAVIITLPICTTSTSSISPVSPAVPARSI